MATRPAPDWSVHLPAGTPPGQVDLADGGTLPGAWTRRWAADPHRGALVTPDGTVVSAAELADRTAVAAARYAAAGLRSGDRLVMSAGPGVDMIVAYVGALRLGLSVVPVSTAYTAPELRHVLVDAAPVGAVLDDPSRLPGPAALRAITTPDLAGLPARAVDVPLDRAGPDDTALVVYTSGTTGTPKGAALSHANVLASAHAVRIAWRWDADDRLALCLPLFHIHGLGVGLHGALTAGGSVIVLPRFDPAGLAAAIGEHRASMFFGVPTMYHRLAGSAHLDALRALRLAVSGSAALSPDLHAAITASTGQRVLERYGMSETVMLVSNPYDGERRPGTVGLPLPGVSVRLATPTTTGPWGAGSAGRTGCGDSGAAGQAGGGPGTTAGEIEVTGPNVFAGYLNDPGATGEAFTVDGWFRTGDVGQLDADGYLRIVGRSKEMIITGGFNVYPREVEEVLAAHPGVAEAAVIGVPSAEWGETVVAFVVPRKAVAASRSRNGFDAFAGDAGDVRRDELVEWCARRLAPYKLPRDWRWVDALPRNAMGKVLRHQLRP